MGKENPFVFCPIILFPGILIINLIIAGFSTLTNNKKDRFFSQIYS